MSTRPAFHFPPFRMKIAAAAHYCGMSQTSFQRAIDAGKFQPGREDIGGRYWLRENLEAAMLEQKPIRPHRFGARI